LKPNTECADKDCVKAQSEKRVYLKKVETIVKEDTGPVHKDMNLLHKYGISVVSSSHEEKPKETTGDFVREFDPPTKQEVILKN